MAKKLFFWISPATAIFGNPVCCYIVRRESCHSLQQRDLRCHQASTGLATSSSQCWSGDVIKPVPEW